MMKRSEYWIGKKKVVRRRWGALLVAAALCVPGLAGCGEHDRALVLSVQDAGSVSDTVSGMGDRSELGTAMSQADAAGKLSREEAVAEQPILLYIHVCGAVVSPGVVEVPEGSRVADALKAAGGLSESGDTEYVNLAAKVTDGQQLYFPTREEAESLTDEKDLLQQKEPAAQKPGSDKVNLNTAGLELLCTLPGIGEARAQDIIAYREAHGAFAVIEDIKNVSGIKESVFQKLKDKITVD